MITSVRFMSPNPVTIQEVADRVNYVLSTFDKIDTEKLNLDCRFDKVGYCSVTNLCDSSIIT